MNTNDKPLPAIGTRWSDIAPEDRQRMPVGTILGAPDDIPSMSPLTRAADGRWLSRNGAAREGGQVDNYRPILSYPPGTDAYPSDEEAAAVDGFARGMVDAGTKPAPEVKPLPAIGTRWGDVSPEDRERLPVGTRLGAIPYREWTLPLTRTSGGVWCDDNGTWVLVSGLHTTRPILSYPTDAGIRADLRHPDDRGDAPATTPEEPTVNTDKIPPRPWVAVNGHVRDHTDRHVVGITSIRWTVPERDAIIEHIAAAVNAYDPAHADRAQVLLSTAEAELAAHRQAWALMHRAVSIGHDGKLDPDAAGLVGYWLSAFMPSDAESVVDGAMDMHNTLATELTEARAEAERLRAQLAALDLPTYPRASVDEPIASITPPRGWEWAGTWAPSGALTADGVPVWRRAVRRVEP